MSVATVVKSVVATPPLTLTGDSGSSSLPPLSAQEYIDIENQYTAKGLGALPIVLARGRGARVWDTDGQEYIDFLSCFSVVNQGHAHPRIVKAMVDQCQKLPLTSRGIHNPLYPMLARKLCTLLGYDKVCPMNSGSETVDLAIKIARKWAYTVKKVPADQAIIVTISKNYHGRTLAPLAGSDNDSIRRGYGPFMPGVGPVVAGRTVRFSNLEDLEYAFAAAGDRIAAVMVECIQGYAGCLPPDDGYLPALAELCKKHRALFVADEIQTGFGRTGYLMAYEKDGVKPDMVLLSKALSGGLYPMGLVLGTEEVMGVVETGE